MIRRRFVGCAVAADSRRVSSRQFGHAFSPASWYDMSIKEQLGDGDENEILYR